MNTLTRKRKTLVFDEYRAAQFVRGVLAITDGTGPARSDTGTDARSGGIRAVIGHAALEGLVQRLAISSTAAHRAVAAALADAQEAGDYGAVRSMLWTATRRPDLRAEKIVSRRYRCLWICNPKVASRSIIAALLAADPDAELIRGRTVDQILAARPEVAHYYSFAFVRHPCRRAFSFYADKHTLARRDPDAYRWFIEPFHGIRLGMGFGEFCRWLSTSFGSDAFADRHWLSQHRQIRAAGGRLPDFVGAHERLDADWRILMRRLEIPFRELPRLNVSPPAMLPEQHLDAEATTLLKRRYAEDFRLGGYPW